jgi:hypothetical protein
MHWSLRPCLVLYPALFADGQASNAVPVENLYQDVAIEAQMSSTSLWQEQMAQESCC